jgi:transposase-like protein
MTGKTEADEQRRAWRRWSEEEACAALAELAQTGESAVGFARRKGVSTQRLQYWKKRLASAPSSSQPAFVAVTLPRSPAGRPEIEIRVGEITVVVREGCDVEQVARLVDALTRRTRAC